MKVIVATNNQNKMREIREIFGGIDLVSLAEAGINIDIEENGSSFVENALIKARAIYDMVKMPVLSDDSGLTVRALGGEPGVYSARYAGAHGNSAANNELLIGKMRGKSDRYAEFVCAVAFICEKGEFTAEGRAAGEITNDYVGGGGFGYDPLFYSYDLQKSFGTASSEEKNSVSHRARALKNLKSLLAENNIILDK